jgi:GNAT superfamily N-acetyltransferase
MGDAMTIEELDGAGAEAELPALATILEACVGAGASVNFIAPFTRDDAAAWWRLAVLPALAAGERRLLVARAGAQVGGRILGTVQLALAPQPNQPHRADVTKLLVHPDGRRRGLARALMLRVEALAREEGRWLLTLDTTTDSPADRLYRTLGYTAFGTVPRYARGRCRRASKPRPSSTRSWRCPAEASRAAAAPADHAPPRRLPATGPPAPVGPAAWSPAGPLPGPLPTPAAGTAPGPVPQPPQIVRQLLVQRLHRMPEPVPPQAGCDPHRPVAEAAGRRSHRPGVAV